MKYIKLGDEASGKTPIHKLDKSYSRAEIADHPNVAILVEEPYVVVDIDTEQEAKILYHLIVTEGINSRIMKTSRGYHFWFKTSEPMKNSIKSKTGLTIHADYRSWGRSARGESKKSYVKVKDNGEWREVINPCKLNDLDEIPRWLKPTGSKYSFLGHSEGDGRNGELYEYILTLQNAKYTQDEVRETIRLINEYVFDDPLPEEELEVILREEAFIPQEQLDEREWFTEKGVFIHNNFAEFIIKNMKIITYHGITYVYQDGYYQQADTIIEQKMIDLYPSITNRWRQEVLSYIRIVTHIDEPDTDEYFVNVINGRLDIRTGILYSHTPDIVDFARINAEYEPNAYHQDTHMLLQRVFVNDEQLFKLFTQSLGFTLTKNAIMQQAFFLSGGDSNGKSSILEMVMSFIGYENVSALSLTDMEHSFKPAELENRLINIGDDISNISIKDTGKFKKLVSGDGVMVERKNQRPFQLRNYATLWFSANKMPSFGDKSDGMDRRITILPFNAKFSPKDKDYDPDILDKVRTPEARSYLLRLAIEGLQSLRADGRFIVPDAVMEIKESYKIESSTVLSWVDDEELTAQDLLDRPIDSWYLDYKTWCQEAGVLKPFARKTFTKEISAHFGLGTKQARDGEKRYRYFDFAG